MATKRGLNMARGLGALIPQDKQTPKAAQAEQVKERSAYQAAKTPAKSTAKTKTAKQSKKAEEAAGKPRNKPAAAKAEELAGQAGAILTLHISEVVPNKAQPRTVFDEEALAELAASIAQHGVLQPLLVQKKGRFYEIIAGERRWRAAKQAGLAEIPALVQDFSPQEAVEISLIENIQREDLNAIEEALAYKRLIEEFDLKQETLAKRVSKSRSAVTNALRLLQLDEQVQELLVNGRLSAGHARALLALESTALQYQAAGQILKNDLSVRETEALVKRLQSPAKRAKRRVNAQMEAVLLDLQNSLTEHFGTKVQIRQGRGKRGKIEIEYYSPDELDRIIELLRS